MRHNPYPGNNAPLNSMLQTPGSIDQPSMWSGFYSQHITNIVEALNMQLPDHYIAIGEHSLQTRNVDVEGIVALEKPKPDVSVYQQGAAQAGIQSAALLAPTWEVPMVETLEPIKHPMAAVIRELLPQRALGRIVARIELLSPVNKPGGRHYEVYAIKRSDALESDVPLIEIDYLHESASLIPGLPAYPAHPDARPYAIIVSDPRPDWQQGKVRVYGFLVGSPVAAFPLPLADDERLDFNLDPVYQQTFRLGRWGDLLDYTVEPERFHTYSATDQARIRTIMAAVHPQS